MASHIPNYEVHTLRTENHNLKIENHLLTRDDAALRVTNAREHQEFKAELKKMESKPGQHDAFKGRGDFKIFDGRKDVTGHRSTDYEAKSGHTQVPHDRITDDATIDRPSCDANNKDGKPTPNAEGFNRVTHCGPDGKPTDRTAWDLDGKTKLAEITYGADGGKKMISFARNGNTAGSVQVDHPNGDAELTTLGAKGNIPADYTRFNNDGSQLDIACNSQGKAVSSKTTGLHLETIYPKSAEDKLKLEIIKASVCKPVDLGPYKPDQ